ncbi:DUF3710 domain-containing protein [Kytococcus sp. Marseille-QA3725]
MALFKRSRNERDEAPASSTPGVRGADLSDDELHELGLSADEVDRMGGLEALLDTPEEQPAVAEELPREAEQMEPAQRDMLRAESEEAAALGLPRPTGLRSTGPYDSTEVPSPRNRVEMGSIWVPGIAGMQMRLETDRATGAVTAVNVLLGDSNLQLQAYAAPISGGLWDEIRTGLVEGLEKSGSHGAVVEGPLGSEIHARMPRTGQLGDGQGKARTAPVRFVGVDGPRWFLRAVISGPAAVDREKAGLMYALIKATVVHRDDVPREPRSLLPLHLPSESPEDGSMGARSQPRGGSASAG